MNSSTIAMWSGQSETTVTHVGTSFAVFCNDYICSPCVNPGLRGQHSFIIVKHHHTGKGKPHGPFKLTVQCSDNSKKQKENSFVIIPQTGCLQVPQTPLNRGHPEASPVNSTMVC